MGKLKILIISIVTTSLFVVFLFSMLIYISCYRTVTVFKTTSETSTLEVRQIGSTKGGKEKVEVVLNENRENEKSYMVYLDNDNKSLKNNNVEVEWKDKSVTITLKVSGQRDDVRFMCID